MCSGFQYIIGIGNRDMLKLRNEIKSHLLFNWDFDEACVPAPHFTIDK